MSQILTNAFSKKVENLANAVALHFMYYNYCRIHRSLRMTPAMAAGVTDHLWKIEDIVGLLEDQERAALPNLDETGEKDYGKCED